MSTTYIPGASVKKARQALEQTLSARPGSYESKWGTQIQDVLERILNRPDFSYDPGSDSLYRQYRDRYVNLGRQAMADTMGKAQAQTGGYGNSYAQTAGQQTYHQYLQALNDRVPELYQLALQRYEAEGEGLHARLSALRDQESTDYSRHRDSLSQWQSDRDFLADQYALTQDRDFAAYESLRDHAFRQAQAAAEQQRWQAEFNEAKRRYDQDFAAAQASAAAKAAGGGSGGSRSYSNGGVDTESVKAAQRFVGTTADGMWGSNSKKAAKAMGYGSLQEVLAAMGKTGSAPRVTNPSAASAAASGIATTRPGGIYRTLTG